MIPGLNDDQIPRILSAARDAGARRAFMVALRLPGETAAVFETRLREAAPMRADRVLRAVQQMRGGNLNSARFGERMRGGDARWQAIEALFALHCRRLGLQTRATEADDGPPPPPRQRGLFDC